jgi:hypothetical protein
MPSRFVGVVGQQTHSLWCSRNGRRKRPSIRCVVYLCYQPRSMATEAQLAKKRKALEAMRMTRHWPFKVILFSESFRRYDKVVKEITRLEKPVLNKFGLRLAGY